MNAAKGAHGGAHRQGDLHAAGKVTQPRLRSRRLSWKVVAVWHVEVRQHLQGWMHRRATMGLDQLRSARLGTVTARTLCGHLSGINNANSD